MLNLCISICFVCIFFGSFLPVIISNDPSNISISDCVQNGTGFYIFLFSMVINIFPFWYIALSIDIKPRGAAIIHKGLGLIAGTSLLLVAAVTNEHGAHTPIAMILFVCALIHSAMTLWLPSSDHRHQHVFITSATAFVLIGIINSFYTQRWIAAFEFSFVTIFSFYLTTFWEKKPRRKNDENTSLLQEKILITGKKFRFI